ncbi:MAG: hypothetical protein Q8O42_10480 [Acidobacteriota bacterium]|nr:hypothetical protein [Acidobacteriota bacterium]
MWWGIGVAGGLVVVALSLLGFVKRSRPRQIDVGSVSESWLAEHRGRTSDS